MKGKGQSKKSTKTSTSTSSASSNTVDFVLPLGSVTEHNDGGQLKSRKRASTSNEGNAHKKLNFVSAFTSTPEDTTQFSADKLSLLKSYSATSSIVYSNNNSSNVSIPLAMFDTIVFNFMSTEEIQSWSVMEVTAYKLSGSNSLFDLRLGPSSMNEVCATCKGKWKVCPGHFGHINLPQRVPHPLRMKNIAEYLSLFCFDCYRLVISGDRMKLFAHQKKSGEARFRALLKDRECNVNTCPHCNNTLPEFTFDEEHKFYRKYKNRTFPVNIREIEMIFDNIPHCDIEELGFDSQVVHPSQLLLGALLVIPPCARSYVKNASGINHDDLTIKYQEIVKAVQKYEEVKANPKQRQDVYESICTHIRTLMDNSKGKVKNAGNKRSIKSIKQRMVSKAGLIRGHIQGKRVDFCARSVITPEATTWVDELVVPEVFAKNLSFPVRVNKFNLAECQRFLDNDKVNNIIRDGESYSASKKIWTRGFELRDNDIILRSTAKGEARINVYIYKTEFNKMPDLLPGDKVLRYDKVFEDVKAKERIYDYKLKPGDIIERQLVNGDWTLFNRQPTLWKGSMRAMKVKIMPGETLRFNLACTAAFNADFDGDEMNMFLCQSEQTRAEAKELVSVGKNFTSSQDSKPMLSIKQDAMTGAYKLTYGRVPIRPEVFMDCFTHERYPLHKYMEKRAHIFNVYKQFGMLDKDATEEDPLMYCGHTLFSFLLPDDFEYFIQNGMSPIMGTDGKPEPICIKRGVLISGTLNKTAMGNASASLIHHLWKDHGEDTACWFVSMYQICINFWFQHEGFSIGLEDFIPANKEVIHKEMSKCFIKAHALLLTESDPELKEIGVMTELNKAATVGQMHAKAALQPTNNLVSMIRSGAKGDWLNITQVTGIVGQQYVSAQRIPKVFGNRTLPHFVKQGTKIADPDTISENAKVNEITKLFKSRGFVTSSFYNGLQPEEFFFHAAGGREGLIDTGCKTADTGYGQRRLTKMMEDFRTSYTGIITNSINNVIQFDYGGDNLDASHLIDVGQGVDKQFSFVHAQHLSDQLCAHFEDSLVM